MDQEPTKDPTRHDPEAVPRQDEIVARLVALLQESGRVQVLGVVSGVVSLARLRDRLERQAAQRPETPDDPGA